LSYEDAASLPEACTTAYDALVAQAGVHSGDRVLVHAAGSGVGTAAVQIARAVGARVLGTARTQDKLVLAEPLGLAAADAILVGKDGRFAEAVRARTTGDGVDVVLELVGGAYVAEDLACVATRARIVLIGLVAGPRVDLDLGAVLRRRLTIVGTVLRARPLEEKIVAGQLFARHVMPLVEQRLVRPVIDTVLPLERAAVAHERIERNESFGKIVLTVARA
jgi:NADPH:quinone reductase-like Zn-dependent oxidoreductase